MPGSVNACHRVDVKTVVSVGSLRDAIGKNSQEFTGSVAGGHGVSARVTRCHALSCLARHLDAGPLQRRKARDTVQRMVATVARTVLVSAAEAGLGRIRHGCATVWHGTRNTVPSIAFHPLLPVFRCGRGDGTGATR